MPTRGSDDFAGSAACSDGRVLRGCICHRDGWAIWLALRVTPLQTVSAAGQTAQVGATLPNASLRGPGELDLFGQVMATKPQFTGVIRPKLALEHITIDSQVVQMLRAQGQARVELTLSQQLAAGWERYFVWETLIAVGFAVIPLVAVAAVRKRPALWKMLAWPASRWSAWSTWAGSR